MQAKFPLFSANVATRLAWLRERQGLTLGQLAGGTPSTAKSWEDGKEPRRNKWRPIADRLGLSEDLIFMGRPASPSDYAFIEKHRNEIAGAEQLLTDMHSSAVADRARPHLNLGALNEPPQAPYAARVEGVASRIPQEQRRPADRGQCEAYFASLMERAELSKDPNAWPVILHRLKKQFPLDEWEQQPPEEEQ